MGFFIIFVYAQQNQIYVHTFAPPIKSSMVVAVFWSGSIRVVSDEKVADRRADRHDEYDLAGYLCDKRNGSGAHHRFE